MTRCGPVTICKHACTSGHIRSSCRSPCGADDTGFKAGRDLLSGHSLAVTDQNLGVPDPKDQRLQPRAPGAQGQSKEQREEMGQSVCVCVFIHMCICMCVCVHPRVYMHVPVCMYMCICMCMHTHVSVHANVCACTCTCVSMCTRMCVCVHMCVCLYVCTRVYVCLCVHVYVCLCVQTAVIRHKWPWVALLASLSCVPLRFYWQRAKCFQVRVCCWVCLFPSWEWPEEDRMIRFRGNRWAASRACVDVNVI